VLLNGDTVFDAEILRRVLAAPEAPLTMAIDQKAAYDDDDMKVNLDEDGQLRAVSKVLSTAVDRRRVDWTHALSSAGESRVLLRAGYGDPQPCDRYAPGIMTSSTDRTSTVVNTVSINGLWWREIDTPQDLADAPCVFRPLGA
jgi:choline kinase